MALNKNLKDKIMQKAEGDSTVNDSIIRLLEGIDEGRQLKRILEPILKTL